MLLCVSGLVFADDETAGVSPAAIGGSGPVDESTLLIGEAGGPAQSGLSVSAFTFWDLARMVLVLACVVAALYLVFYLIRKAGAGRVVATDAIRVIGTHNLPGNRAFYLVKVGPQVFLVGAGGDSVNLIAEISDRETVDSLIIQAGELGVNGRRTFSEMIASFVKGGQSASLDLLRAQRQRLERLRR